MKERYTKVFSLPENLYAEDSPVIIRAGALLTDNKENKVCVQIKMQSIADKQIKAVKVLINTYDVSGNALDSRIQHYLDLSVKRNDFFGQDSLVVFDNENIRAFKAGVQEVIFTDGEVISVSCEAVPLPSPVTISEYFCDAVLTGFYKDVCGQKAVYSVSDVRDLWICACGAYNHQGETSCNVCKCDREKYEKYLDSGILRKEIYDKASALFDKKTEAGSDKAKRYFDKLNGYGDSNDKAEMCRQHLIEIDDERKAEEGRKAAEAAEKAEEERQKKIAAQKRENKKIAIFLSALAVCIVIGACIKNMADKARYYDCAVEYMNSGNYDSAISLFENLGSYKDSADMINETNYVHAVNDMNNGDYDSAIAMFKSLGSYKDSADMINETNYIQAVNDMNSGRYDDAIAMFKDLGSYKDSDNMINETNYIHAVNDMNTGRYDNAIAMFKDLGSYKDSAEMINETNYIQAVDAMNKGWYGDAIVIFESLGNYKDSPTMALTARYEKAVSLMDQDQYAEAIEEFSKIEDFKDSKELLTKTYEEAEKVYKGAEKDLERGYYDNAEKKFRRLNDYKDSEKKADEVKKVFTDKFKDLADQGKFYQAFSLTKQHGSYGTFDELMIATGYEDKLKEFRKDFDSYRGVYEYSSNISISIACNDKNWTFSIMYEFGYSTKTDSYEYKFSPDATYRFGYRYTFIPAKKVIKEKISNNTVWEYRK